MILFAEILRIRYNGNNKKRRELYIMEEKGIRLNKYLSEAGICSRREADRLVEKGSIRINGNLAQMGMRVMPGDVVEVNGKVVKKEEEVIILALYKPEGIVCTAEKREPDNIIDYLNYPKRLMYAGRLDKMSEGLIIMTNQGELIQQMMRAKNEHEKEYIVTVDKPVTQLFMEKLKNGIWLPDPGVKTRKCKAEIIGKRTFRIILTQGINRQIRKMCMECGYRVRKLLRTRIMNIELGDLKKGSYRTLSDDEIRELYRRLKQDAK